MRLPNTSPLRWPSPFAVAAEGEPPRLRPREWILLVAAFALIHWLSLLISTWGGNFDPQPNHDHVHVMHQVLEQGYPTLAIWPPGYGYYLAFQWQLTRALGLPFWSAKAFVDVFLVVLSGLLSVALALRLTRNRFLAVCSGLAMVTSPIFAMASAEGLALVLFQPIFLAGLLVLVRGLWKGVAMGTLAGAGALIGLACLVRGNPQFLLLAMPPVAWWCAKLSGRTRPAAATAGALAVALLAQAAVLSPWISLQRRLGESGAVAAPVVYYAFFDGIRRHDGFVVSEALRQDADPPPLSFAGVVEFHRHWLAENPLALAKLYVVKAVRTWYLSDSGRWDTWILVLHAPLWFLAVAGALRWLRRAPRDPALWTVLVVITYFWAVSAAVSGLARYMAPTYGLLGLLAGVALHRTRRPPGTET